MIRLPFRRRPKLTHVMQCHSCGCQGPCAADEWRCLDCGGIDVRVVKAEAADA
jgi:hypothetical protein